MEDKVVKEKMLEDLKRSNKERKLYLAKKYGFESVEEYKAYLEKGPSFPEPNIQKVESKVSSKIATDIVIAFDTTGSMREYIGAVKVHVKELIPQLFDNTENVKIGIVAFGDYCDMKSSDVFGKAYQVIDLTDNANKLIDFVSSAKDTSGGDTDEFYELVIKKIKDETSWRKDSNKAILLIGDCGPHGIGYSYITIIRKNQIDWRDEAFECKRLGIKIDTLSINGHPFYKEVSEITNGVCLPFKSSNKTSVILDGYVASRSGSSVYFAETMTRTMASGDDELIGVYKTLSTL